MRPVLTLQQSPVGDVVTLAEAKEHLRVEHTAEDALIADLVTAAVEKFDARHGILGRALLTQDWGVGFSAAQVAGLGRKVILPFPPVQDVLSVRYVDRDGIDQTMSAADYDLVADEDSAAAVLADEASWPDVDDREMAMTITLRCGYGLAAAVPSRLRRAILADVATMYRMRESAGDKVEQSPFYNAVVDAFRVHWGLT